MMTENMNGSTRKETTATSNTKDTAQAMYQPPVSNPPAIVSGFFQAESEEELVGYIKNLTMRLQVSTIAAYWKLGRSINFFYNGKYGTQELKNIAIATDIGEDTLAKACRFARQYSEEQLRILLTGKFSVSWFRITQNLTIEPAQLIEAYKSSSSTEQFYNFIIKLKNPAEKRGKAKQVTGATVAMSTSPPVIEVEDNEATSEVEISAVAIARSDNELEKFRAENEQLRKELSNRDDRIKGLEQQLVSIRDIYEDQVSEMLILKDKYNSVIEMIEQNTPATYILQAIEANS